MISHRQIVLTLGVLSAFCGFIAKLIYRPWIIKNKIDDLSFNEFAPSLFYTVGLCLIVSGFIYKKPRRDIIIVGLGSLTYEIEQIWTTRTFDIMDLLAIIVGVAIALSLFIKTKITPRP